MDVVALGELLIDFAPVSTNAAGYPTLAAQPGGAPGNFLAALQIYGCTTALIGKVGADRFGDLLKATLAEKGIETRGIVSDPAVFTTLAFVTLDATGNREFSFARKPGADTCLRAGEVDLALIDGAKVFHFGTLSLTDEPARAATQKAVAYAKEKGRLISFDPNLRKPLWPSETAAKEQIEWGLHQADIVKISDEEIAFLWGLSPEEGAQKLLKEYGVQPEAWGPFAEGNHGIFTHPVLTAIGQKYGKSAAQVALRWNVQRGVTVIPKSVHKERMEQNLDIWDFQLSDGDMAEIAKLDIGHSEIVDHSDPKFVQMLHSMKIHE